MSTRLAVSFLLCAILFVCLFHIHQSIVAYSILQGFWYISSDDDRDYYMLLEDNHMQIIGTSNDSTTVILDEDVSFSCKPTLTIGKFCFQLQRKQASNIPVLGLDTTDMCLMYIYQSCGVMDIESNDSIARVVKDNSMTNAYNAM